MAGISAKRGQPLGHQDLAALRANGGDEPDQWCQPGIAEPGREHDAACLDHGGVGTEPKAVAGVDRRHAKAAADSAASPLERGLQGPEQAQRLDLAVMRAEAGAHDPRPEAGHQPVHLAGIEDRRVVGARGRLVVHAQEQHRPLVELRPVEAKAEPAGLPVGHVDPGQVPQPHGKVGPGIGRGAGPGGIGGRARSLASHPDQAEIAARGVPAVLALVEEHDALTRSGEAERHGTADQPGADHRGIEAEGLSHAGRFRRR